MHNYVEILKTFYIKYLKGKAKSILCAHSIPNKSGHGVLQDCELDCITVYREFYFLLTQCVW